MDPALAARIERLRRRPDRSAALGLSLGRSLGGRWLADGILHRRTIAEGPSGPAADLRLLAPEAVGERLLFVDTETTGLAGGTGTKVFLVGTGELVDGSLRVEQFLLARPSAEATFWDAIDEHLGARFALVSYNGKSFDWPLLEARRRLVGRRDQGAERLAAHLDLVHPMRRAFAARWPDCRLATCEERLLGLRRAGDLGGEFAPSAYREFLAGRDATALARIVEHHRQDIVSLALLLPRLAAAFEDPLALGADPVGVARFWLQRREPERAAAVLASVPEREACWTRSEALQRCGRWAEAVALWDRLAAAGDTRALEALAKFHEHRARAPARALRYCRALVSAAPEVAGHRRRLARLERRVRERGVARDPDEEEP